MLFIGAGAGAGTDTDKKNRPAPQHRYIEKKFCLFSRNNLTIKKLRFFLQTNYFKNLFSPL